MGEVVVLFYTHRNRSLFKLHLKKKEYKQIYIYKCDGRRLAGIAFGFRSNG